MSQIIKRIFKKSAVRAFLGFTIGATAYYSYFTLFKVKQPQTNLSSNNQISSTIAESVIPIHHDINKQSQSSQSVINIKSEANIEQSQELVQEKIKVVESKQAGSQERKEEKLIQQTQTKAEKEIQTSQVLEPRKEEKQEKPVPLERKVFKQIKDITELNFQDLTNKDEKIMIVIDLPYNEQFQSKILAQVNRIRELYGDVKIYRKDITNPQTLKTLQTKYNARVKDQTIFLVKNPHEKGLTNIDFDIFMQYPAMTDTYLKNVTLYDQNNVGEVIENLKNLTPSESVLLYLYDKDEPEEKIKDRVMAAKYIELELILNRLPSVRVQAVEKKAAIGCGLIEGQIARTNSVHLYRKHNIYTPLDPNFYLSQEGGLSIPFHRVVDIALFARGSQNLMVQHYLASLQTFDAMANPAPFMCTLRIDRNKVSQYEYNRIIRLFGLLKIRNRFSNVSYSIKLKSIPFSGKEVPINKDWQITLSNVEELDKEASMHEIKTVEQLKELGYQEDTFLKSSNEYLYEHTELNEELLRQFIQKGVKGQLPKYYRSEEDHPLAPIRGLVGTQFNGAVINNQGDHLVYQYSQFCPTCKRISPIMGAFARVIQEKGMGLQNLTFHKLDANKNRVKGQLCSPYIPNIFYYKKEWKQIGPVRFPIEMLGSQGLISLYAFCSITNQIKSVSWSLIQDAIKVQKEAKDIWN